MRLGSLFALGFVIGCKAQPGGSTAPSQAPEAETTKTGALEAEDPEPVGDQGDATPDAGDPEQRFCEKLTQLMIASRDATPDPASRQELVETCVANARRKRAEEPAAFKREVECIATAAELGTFFDCALDDPGGPAAASDEQFLPLCEKLAELARNEPDFPEEAKRELQDTARCAADARMEHRAAPQAFERIETCILAATGMRGAAECTAAGTQQR